MHGLSLSIPSPGADYGEESTRTRTQARYLTRSIRVCITLNRSVLLKHCIASYCLLHTATRSPLSRLLTSLSISHVCTVERLPIVTRTCMGIGQAPSDLVSFLPSMHSPKLASTLSITYTQLFFVQGALRCFMTIGLAKVTRNITRFGADRCDRFSCLI